MLKLEQLKVSGPQPGQDPSFSDPDHFSTGFNGFDLIIPPGLVQSSVYFMGSESGAGKTTLLLQMGDHQCRMGRKVLLFSGEESAIGIARKMEKHSLPCKGMMIVTDGDLSRLAELVRNGRFDLVLIDSFQTLYDGSAHRPSYAEQADTSLKIRRLADRYGTVFFMVSQVNRDGDYQGSRAVVHNVDVALRMVRGVSDEVIISAPSKNRQSFGAATRVVFRRTPKGLCEKEERETGHLPRHDVPYQIGLAACPVFVDGDYTADEFTAVSTGAADAVAIALDGAPATTAKFLSRVIKAVSPEAGLAFVLRANRLEQFERAGEVAVAIATMSAFFKVPLPVNVVYMGSLDSSGRLLSVPDMELRARRAFAQGYSMVIGPRRIGTEKPVWTECNDLHSVARTLQGAVTDLTPEQSVAYRVWLAG